MSLQLVQRSSVFFSVCCPSLHSVDFISQENETIILFVDVSFVSPFILSVSLVFVLLSATMLGSFSLNAWYVGHYTIVDMCVRMYRYAPYI